MGFVAQLRLERLCEERESGNQAANHFYEYSLFCLKCQTTYHIEEAKRFVEPPPSLF